jgi:threonine synthase
VRAAADEPLSRLIASGVQFKSGKATPETIATAIDISSAQGWRRPLLAWLGVQEKRAEAAGDAAALERIRRRIALVSGKS